MKVGTDAVLLGAWANASKPCRILDIGTGCGVIALMLAQRFEQALIDAIDIDTNSIGEARSNFNSSPWSNRLKAHLIALQDWEQPGYDLIVSNPPYFANSFPIEHKSRALARTHSTLDFGTLITRVNRLLNPGGNFSLVLPAQFRAEIEALLTKSSLYIHRETSVLPSAHKSASLLLLACSQAKVTAHMDDIIIRTDTGYHPTYLKLTRDFYLFS